MGEFWERWEVEEPLTRGISIVPELWELWESFFLCVWKALGCDWKALGGSIPLILGGEERREMPDPKGPPEVPK